MAQNPPSRARRKAVRYGVPVAVAGAAALTVGLVPALADAGGPDLPRISAEKLLAKMTESDVRQFSGTVRVSADLGLPALPGGGGSGAPAPSGSGPHDGRGGEGTGGPTEASDDAAPGKKLLELASGEHTLRVAADGPDKHRVSVVERAAEYSVVHNGSDLWAYDSAGNAAHHLTLPKGGQGTGHTEDRHAAARGLEKATPQEAARQALKAVDGSTSVTVDGTAKVAGRDAYQLLIEPKGAAHSTVRAIRVAVDAEKGVPLTFSLTSTDGGKPVVDLAYTSVDFAKPPARTFTFTPPKGAEVTEGKVPAAERGGLPGGTDGEDRRGGDRGAVPDGLNILGKGWGAVAEFELPGGKLPAGALAGAGGGAGRNGAGEGGAPEGLNSPAKLLDSLTEKVDGDFGTGRLVGSRLVNALITEDGKIYAGAVTKEGLVAAADRAAG